MKPVNWSYYRITTNDLKRLSIFLVKGIVGFALSILLITGLLGALVAIANMIGLSS